MKYSLFCAGIGLATTFTLIQPSAEAAFRRVSATECVADESPATITARYNPTLGFWSTSSPGTGVICPLNNSEALPNADIVANGIKVYVRDDRFGTSGADNDFTVKACRSNYLVASSCGTAASTAYDPGDVTLLPDPTAVKITGDRQWAYLYVDLPQNGNVGGEFSWFTGYRVDYP
ncbi:MAG: hypothetical protein HOW73_19780 [Polyangiaceae bacterium]|nr:hypothetical protein [Polyangiaceae bacterium]